MAVRRTLLLAAFLLPLYASAQTVIISPAAPVVNQGATQQFTAQAPAAFVLVNSAVAAADGSSTTIASAAQNVTAGNLLVVGVRINGHGDAISSVTDTALDSFSKCALAYSDGGTGSSTDIWYARNVAGNAANVTTVNYSVAETLRAIVVLQYSGADTTAACEAGANGYNNPPVTSTSFSPAVAGNLNVAFAIHNSGGGSVVWTAGTNYVLRANSGSASANDLQSEDRQSAPAGSQTASITATGGIITFSVASFKAALGPAGAGTWTSSGTDSSGAGTTSAGSINSSTGLYTAPGNVTAQQSLGGYQIFPNNHLYNTRIDSLPVNANNTTWLNTVNTGSAPFGLDTWVGGPVNFITPGTSSTVAMTFLYTPLNNGNWEIPLFPAIRQENGYFAALHRTDGSDHHLFSIDTSSGTLWEQYQYLIPLTTTGASVTGNVATLTFGSDPNAAFYSVGQSNIYVDGFTGGDTYFNGGPYTLTALTSNSASFALTHADASASSNGVMGSVAGCATCNSASGYTYHYYDYLLPVNNATDAAGMAITPLQYRLQEIERAVATGGTVSHAVRMTFAQGYECSCLIWPATAYATDGGVVPFGARIRLKSSFNISSYSAIAQVLMKQMQQYGWFNADGGINWDVSGEQNAWPKAYVDAMAEVHNSGISYTITNTAVTGNVITVTAANGLAVNNVVTLLGPTNCGGTLNFDTLVVASASGSQFTAPLTHADCASAPDTGTVLSRITNFMEFVDESGLMVSSVSGLTTHNREIVTFTRTSDSATASVDVALQGVVVNFPKDYLYIMAGTPAQQLPVLVNIGTVTWSMSPSVGTLTSGGLYTPPTTQVGKTTTTITATSTTNAAVAAQLNVVVFPSAAIRILPSRNDGTDYTDSHGNVWYGFTGTNQPQDLQDLSTTCGNVAVFTDSSLYDCEIGGNYAAPETRVEMLVPNGTYQLTYHLGTFRAIGSGLWKLSTQGNVVYTGDFSADAGGINKPYTFITPVTVTDNHLAFASWRYTETGGPLSSFQAILVGTTLTPNTKVTSGVTVK